MKPATLYYVGAILPLLLIPLVPKILDLRIWILNAVRLRWLANWHDRHRRTLIPFFRIVLILMTGVLIYLGITSKTPA